MSVYPRKADFQSAIGGIIKHFMPLNNCVETMRQTGIDMRGRCKETSTGSLAVNVVEC
jgi:L-serine dehydratase